MKLPPIPLLLLSLLLVLLLRSAQIASAEDFDRKPSFLDQIPAVDDLDDPYPDVFNDKEDVDRLLRQHHLTPPAEDDYPRHHHRFYHQQQHHLNEKAPTVIKYGEEEIKTTEATEVMATMTENEGPEQVADVEADVDVEESQPEEAALDVASDDQEVPPPSSNVADVADVSVSGEQPLETAAATATTAGTTATSASTSTKDAGKRIWGAAASAVGTASTTTTSASAAAASNSGGRVMELKESDTSFSPSSTTTTMTTQTVVSEHDESSPSSSNSNKTRAFVVPKSTKSSSNNNKAAPPDGYELSARVYIDPHDKLAHFDTKMQHIPYWDCGHAGSTTSPLPLKSAYFRHALTGATSWSGTDGKHAVLVVTLSPVAMDLNSGESQEFPAGSVILLEDVLIAGHKMRPLSKSAGISVLFLTLPEQFVRTGKDHISLPASFLKQANRDDPCPDHHHSGRDGISSSTGGSSSSRGSSSSGSSEGTVIDVSSNGSSSSSSKDLSNWTPRQVRRLLFAVLGMSLSTLAADFLGKTAPLWLAVGVGGTCFVAGGTWAIAVGGDSIWTAIQLQLERRKLGTTAPSIESDDEPETLL